MVNADDLVAVMGQLHAALAPGDLEQTLLRVTEAAVELLPDVDGATITVEHADGRLETGASSGAIPAGLEQTQRELDEGPAVDASGAVEPTSSPPSADVWPGPGAGLDVVDAEMVTSSDLARDERYPTYGSVATGMGVRAQAAVVLFDTPRARGVLSLYSYRSGAFDDTAVLATLFAHHSATALAYAMEYDDRDAADAERQSVGQALGIVMERYALSEASAFALLHRTAAHRGVSVRLVAQELVARTEDAGSQG